MGCVLQGGLGQAPARQAAILGGLDKATPCTTVNKVCASGMKAIMISSANLSLGLQVLVKISRDDPQQQHRKPIFQNVMVAGGMESLSNSPFYLARGNTPYGEVRLRDACHFDALTDAYTSWHMGKCAEKTAEGMSISRQEQDEYSKLSHQRLIEAQRKGVFKDEISPVDDICTDDPAMAPYKIEDIPSMPTPWGKTVTRGSASKLADGAAACVLMNETGLALHKVKPLAEVIGFSDAAQEPVDWPTSPALGITKLLTKLCLKKEDVDMWEINEAFALVVLANAKLLGLNLDKINVNGGAIGLGHPFGMSGARITNHLVHNLKEGQIGVASLCNGGGGASTIVIKKMN